MGIGDYIWSRKKKRTSETPKQKMNIHQVSLRHKTRIDNLLEEVEILSNKLLIIEEDESMPRGTKSKASDIIVQRLTLIKYEVSIREDLISWL